MLSEFRLPALGADMEEGTVVQWNVAPGDAVKRGQVVAVVETDKGAIDVEIFEDGVVRELVVQPGTKVPVGTVLARLETAGQSAPRLSGAWTGGRCAGCCRFASEDFSGSTGPRARARRRGGVVDRYRTRRRDHDRGCREGEATAPTLTRAVCCQGR